jgi:hypothetical protein
MRTFAQRENRLSSRVSLDLTRSTTPASAAHHAVPPILYSHRASGNQAVRRLLHANVENLEVGSNSPSTPGCAHALTPPDAGTREVPQPHFGHDFSRIRIVPAGDASRPPAAFVSLPRRGADEAPISVNQPPSGGSKAPTPTPAPQRKGDDCAAPFAMTKVTSGPFQGGYTMDDYYPKLKGKGLWSHPDTAGPFDTGEVAGYNVQLYGTFPSPCRPETFTLTQTVRDDLAVVDGVHEPTEGQTRDDIAETKNDPSGPPFRRDWLGGGYNASMADPPSVRYKDVQNVEWDQTFVTSLVGPGGRASVTWKPSIRVVNGKVTRNTVQ